MKAWQVIESGRLDAQAIMDKDAELLAALNVSSLPMLHFYEWSGPCLTYGYFIDPAHLLKLDILEKHGLKMARRPTGGGVIFHLVDLAFSVLLPAHHPGYSMNTLENYAFINLKVAEAIALFSSQSVKPDLLEKVSNSSSRDSFPFCMAKPTQYDLIVNGKKMGGAAQRRTKQGLLHQTSLSLCFPSYEIIEEVLYSGRELVKAMKQNSAYLLSASASDSITLQNGRRKIRQALIEVFSESRVDY